MKANSIFSPGEDTTRITLSGTLRLISEKYTTPFLWCPELLFSAPQCPDFPAGSSQRGAPDWKPSVKADLCKMAIDCFLRNSSSRQSSNFTSKPMSRCPPMSSCS
ncbi:hypothetical protein TNCV_3886371 [Trichonephila clavipes]|nr:hypothetical protein TNCV_3886371 [Trichonephila clavipes]